MNIILEIIRFISFIIVGFIIFRWYIRKKGLEYNVKSILLFIVSWKTIMFFILIGIDYIINEQIGRLDDYYYYAIVFFPKMLMILVFIINLLLGILLFEIIFKKIIHEIIIIVIVILEMILDNFVLFPIFFSLTLIS